MEIHPDWILSTLKHYQRGRNIVAIDDILKEPAVENGDNYSSQIWRLTVNARLGSGARIQRSFIVKEKSIEKNLRAAAEEIGAYAGELKMYAGVLSKMEELMVIKNDYRETLWPKMFGNIRDDVMIFEDLCDSGFKMTNRRDLLDLDHTLLVVTELARFHAMGLALLENETILPGDLDNSLFERPNMLETSIVNIFKLFAETVGKRWGSEWNQTADYLQQFAGKIHQIHSSIAEVDPSRLNTVNHGDPWACNIMIRTAFTGDPILVKFVDFQLSHYNSFAFDLTYFLVNSTKPLVRRAHFNEILRVYRDSFVYNALFFGLKAKVPTLKKMIQEMDRLSPIALMYIVGVASVLTSDGALIDWDQYTRVKKGESSEPWINSEVFMSKRFRDYFGDDIAAAALKG